MGNTFATFDVDRNPSMAPALMRCRAVAGGDKWCAFLSGDIGTGKTHLAIAALIAWMAAGRSGHFWKVPAFLAWIRRCVFDDGHRIEDLTHGYTHGGGLIVFDDLGTENQTDWAAEQLYLVLDSRYDLELPTIITTNRDLSRLDPRLLSRYRGGLVVCEGKDIRGEERA